MKFHALILQDLSTTETRAATTGAMLLDHPVTVLRCSLDALQEPATAVKLTSGTALPVGSVEFVREAMRVAGIEEPENMSYPPVLTDFLCREVHRVRAGDVLGTWFVKPCATKAFTGFVFSTLADPEKLDEHDRIRYEAFMALPATESVWISEPVEFLCEWRHYVMGSNVIGRARYDEDGADEAPEPDSSVVALAVQAMGPGSYVLDFGVLDSGETALVEVNDAWAIGHYGKALRPREYLKFLGTRWNELMESKLMSMIPNDTADAIIRRSRNRPR